MESIHLYHDSLDTQTHIPNCFIDRYMPEANGEFVKVYLYLLRNISSHVCSCSISKIADTFNHTENDVIRALNYWERQNLLLLEYNDTKKIVGIRLLDLDKSLIQETVAISFDKQVTPLIPPVQEAQIMPEIQSVPESQLLQETQTTIEPRFLQKAPSTPKTQLLQETQTVKSSQAIQITPTSAINPDNPGQTKNNEHPKQYTLDEIKTFRQNPDISELFFIIETYLKHPLSATDINTILYWYDTLCFPADLIEYLVEYCISKGHSSTRYMDKVALNWKDNNIKTILEAKENAAIHNQVYYAVIKALGITGRNLVESEQAFIRKWTDEYYFDTELIQEACRRTIAITHQPSFEYTDSILSSWSKKNVHTLADIKKLDKEYGNKKAQKALAQTTAQTAKHNKFNNFSQRDYDFEQLEIGLLTASAK